MSQTVNLGHVVGPGVPNGGTAGQVLKKNSGTNFDTSWSDNNAANIPMSGSDNTSIGNAMSKILPVITGTTNNSGYAIAAGEYFEANGGLYQATASIPVDNAWSSSATALTDHGAVNVLNSNIGNLSNLTTTEKTSLVSATNEVNSKSTRTQLCYNTTLLTSHEYGLNDSVQNYDYIEITFGKSGNGSFMSRIIPNDFLNVGSIDTISLSAYNSSTYNAYIECGFPTNNKFRMPTIVQNGWTITPLSIYGIGKRT